MREKNAIWRFFILATAILYGSVTGLYEGHESKGRPDLPKSTDLGKHYFSAQESQGIYCHTSQTESQVSVCGNLTAPLLKDTDSPFSAFRGPIEDIYRSSISRYSFYSRNLLILLRQADLIFPFHDFW